jgi:tetratricopeptide (TPR) repeat protein
VYVDNYVSNYVEPAYAREEVYEDWITPEPAVSYGPTGALYDPSGAVLAPPQEPASPQQVTTPLEAGDSAFRAGDYPEAQVHYVRAQLDGVHSGEAAIAYALAHFAQGDYSLATLALRRGLSEAPDAIQQPLDVAWLYGDASVLEQHVGRLSAHLGQRETDADGWLLLGYVRFGSGDLPGAVEAFGRAAELRPGDVLANLLGESAASILGQWQTGPDSQASAPPSEPGSYFYLTPPEVPE